MQAALPMGGNKITGMADPTVSGDAATKNYVDSITFSTGDGKITLKTVADPNWILCDDGTFGSGSSGGSNRANNDTLALFTLFFNNISDTAAPILTSGGGATTRAAQVSAGAAWAANCRMTLTKQLGRAIAVAGTGAGLTARPLGGAAGGETAVLAANNIPTITSSNASQAIQVFPVGNTQVGIPASLNGTISNQANGSGGAPANVPQSTAGNWTTVTSFSSPNAISVTYTNASPTGVSTVPPETYWNVMVKL